MFDLVLEQIAVTAQSPRQRSPALQRQTPDEVRCGRRLPDRHDLPLDPIDNLGPGHSPRQVDRDPLELRHARRPFPR